MICVSEYFKIRLVSTTKQYFFFPSRLHKDHLASQFFFGRLKHGKLMAKWTKPHLTNFSTCLNPPP
jgi:hypothetical protein